MNLLLICFTLFLIWALYITNFYNKLIFKTFKFSEKLDPNLAEKYKPFERFDRSKWNIAEIYFCAIFLLPIRIAIIVSALVVVLTVLNLLNVNAPNIHNVELPKWKRIIVKFFINHASRLLLFCCGIYWINRRKLKVEDFDPEYAKYMKQNPNIKNKMKAPVIVSNHISWMDAIFHCSDSCPSFLSKAEVASVPFIGACAKAIQCIFVEREVKENRDAVLKAIIEREHNIKNGKDFPPIVIFPEGTTTNGNYLVSFKKGAFEGLIPIKIVCLQYPIRNYNVSLDCISQGLCVLMSLVQLKNNMEVIEFETFYPDYLNLSKENENDWMVYAKKVKDIMLKVMPGVQNSESGYRDCKAYYDYILSIQKGKSIKELPS